jgi:hypothetical protein
MFSDAVLAVAITLLALNLMVQGPGHGSLAGLLFHEGSALAAYVISFFTIGIVWVNHHALLSVIETVDRSLLFFNLILLLFVVLIPNATTLLADYLSVGGSGAELAAVVYGVVLDDRMAAAGGADPAIHSPVPALGQPPQVLRGPPALPGHHRLRVPLPADGADLVRGGQRVLRVRADAVAGQGPHPAGPVPPGLIAQSSVRLSILPALPREHCERLATGRPSRREQPR